MDQDRVRHFSDEILLVVTKATLNGRGLAGRDIIGEPDTDAAQIMALTKALVEERRKAIKQGYYP